MSMEKLFSNISTFASQKFSFFTPYYVFSFFVYQLRFFFYYYFILNLQFASFILTSRMLCLSSIMKAILAVLRLVL